MKTIKVTPPTFGDNELSVTLPTSWEELTDEQLHYVCHLLSLFEGTHAKTRIAIRLLGIFVEEKQTTGWLCRIDGTLFFLANWQLLSLVNSLAWLDTPPVIPVRLAKIGKKRAVDASFHGVSFGRWLEVENLYQGYLVTEDGALLDRIALLLYGLGEDSSLSAAEGFSILLWVTSVKRMFAHRFNYFFTPSGSTSGEDEDMLSTLEGAMNAQIRALSGGDITKENEVLQMDCWRALTELNQKAREAMELRERYGK